MTITDNGPGFSKELKEILTDPLYQISRRTGLGFVILKLAVDFSGGNYRILDKIPGDQSAGSCIEIKLPVLP
ncbi:MAG: ATP-binding protein [Candidatus Odinarchaeota archaeon]